MSFNLFASLTINGLSMGVIYAMVAMALILLIRAVGVLNFAQGDLLMLGAYVACAMFVDWNMPLWIMLPCAIIVYAFIGFIFMLCTYWPLRKASYPVAPIIATIGASLVISEGVPILFGSWPRTMPSLIRDANGRVATITMFGTKIQAQYFLIIAVAIVAMLLVYLLFENCTSAAQCKLRRKIRKQRSL